MLAVRMMSKLALVSELFFLVIFIPRKNVEQYGSMSLSKHVSFCKIIFIYNSNLTASGTIIRIPKGNSQAQGWKTHNELDMKDNTN